MSGLLPSVTGSGYATSNFANNTYTISVTGLQPSGNYSLVGHNHVSSDITDFNNAVSGLIPPSNFTSLTGVSGVTVSNSGTNYTVSLTDPTIQLADITDLSSNGRTFLLTPSSSNLATLISDETGSGFLVFNDSPALSGIPTSPTAPSGTNNTQIANTAFVRNEISNLINSAPSTLDTLNELASALGNDPNFATTITNSLASKAALNGAIFTGSVTIPSGTGNFNSLTVNGTGVSLSGHQHLSSDITNFNSSVSGLLPVKNLTAGSGIGISSLSGDFTISVTGTFGLTSEEVDDRVSNLLVAGTGVSLTYNDPSGILTIDNLHSEINVLSQEPQGFVNRTDSLISFNDATRTFTIQPAISGGSYLIYAEGVKVVKSSIETVVIGSGTALNYIHFDTIPPYALHTKTTGFNFDTDIPIAFIHWNSDINQSTFFGEERHGIRMDSVTHKWIHNTFGMQYISGLSIGGYTLLGNGSLNSHAQIDISDGILYQEDIIINITDDNGANSSNQFVQPLSPIAYIPTYYHSGSTGQWVRDVATSFPLKYNATRAQYNLYSGGTWTTPNVTNNRYFAMWIVATNDMNDPILAILGQREDSSLTAAENNNNWGDINLTNIPTQELRPLYRLIFVTNDTFTNTPKSSLQSILDIRKSIQSISAGVTQNDHGSLFGLGDDDHSQYVHIDNNRTISAVHNFSNGLTAGGLISAASGSFNSLNVNGSGVSLVGHTHLSTDITNFNSSVSGLLPSVASSGYVTSNFSNNTYTIEVTGLQPSGNYSLVGHTHTSSNITDFNSSVSGLLPVTNIVAGTNIGITPSGSIFTIAVSGSLGLTTEEVDDRVSQLLIAGSGINLNYNDNANTLTISVSGLSSSATIGNGSSGVINYDLSQTLNIVGSGSTSIDYNNTSKTITIGSPSLIKEYELVNTNKSTFTVTGGYALNNLDVYHNGIRLLASGDYTAINGSTFSLIQPAVSGDVVEWLGCSVVPRHQLILGEVRSDTVGNINYLGRAIAGSSESSNVWTIKRYTINSNGIDIATATASNVSWNNRLTSSYV